MCEFDTTRVANFMWGLARIKGKDSHVIEPLGMAAAKCLKAQKLLDAKVDLQILATLIWSSAQLQMLSKCLANTMLKETRARIHEFSPCSLASTVWSLDELGIHRLKLMQKVGAAASLLIKQSESKEFLKFNWAFEQSGGKDDSWAKAAASQYECKCTFPSITPGVTLSMQVPVVKA